MSLITPEVIQVYAEEDFKVICFFEDGKVTRYDMSNELKGVFEVLKDINTFKSKITILDNTLAWDLSGKRDDSDCLTIDPCTIYNAEDVTDKYS